MERARFSLAAVLAMLCGCSDGDETVLRSHGEPPDSEDPVLVIGECYGKSTDCSGVPEAKPYVPGSPITCSATHLGTGRVLWNMPRTTPIDCPDPPCTLYYSTIDPAADGSLEVMAALLGPHSSPGHADGVWLARFGPDGERLDARIHGFEIPTRLSEPTEWGLGGYDDLGRVHVTRTLGELSGIVETSVLRIDRSSDAVEELTSIAGIIGAVQVVAPDGSFAVEILSPYDPENLIEELPHRVDVARYDANGRLLWNQPKLTRGLALENGGVAGFDGDGNLTLHLRAKGPEVNPSPQLSDGTLLGSVSHRLARLDPEGNVLWVYEIEPISDVTSAVGRDGSVYLIRKPYQPRSDGFYEKQAPRLERIDPSGRADWSLELPGWDADTAPALALSDDGSALLTTWRGGPVVEHQLIGPDGLVCAIFDRPCSTDADCLSEARIGPDQSVYFRIGRVAKP
jgi:hypothetical protein